MGTRIHSLKYLKALRSGLRAAMTPAEARLWQCLKGGKLAGRKFRRQHSIGQFIVDFYCPSEQLIIELDGQPHMDAGGRIGDEFRDQRLADLGFTVLRFENKRVFQEEEAVIEAIRSHFKGPRP